MYLQPASSRPPPISIIGSARKIIYIGAAISYPPIKLIRSECITASAITRRYKVVSLDGSVINIVVANNVSLVSEQNLDESEYINYDLFTLDEIGELINNHYIASAGNRLAYFELISKTKEKRI